MSSPVIEEARHDEFPLLSTTDRGTRMTRLPPGRPVGRFTGRLAVQALVATAAWALAVSVPCVALLGLAPTEAASEALSNVWAAVAALVIAALAVCVTVNLSARIGAAFGQARLPSIMAFLVVTGGFAVGAGGWLVASLAMRREPALSLHHLVSSSTIPRELGALIGAVFALCSLFALWRVRPAIAHARSRQQTIDRLRRTGTRHAGILTEVTFRNFWLFDRPVFKIQVTYDDRGEARVLPVHMRTTAERVPVEGSRMVVLTDGAGSVHVELDRSRDLTFEADYERYQAPDG